jgi:four helix bundle protein
MELRKASYISPGAAGKRGFEDLECFKLALDVIVNAHDFARTLPADEKYDMVSQIRRAAKSITANIAEGYGRYHYLDSLKFYSNARGSLNEVLGHLINAQVLGYCEDKYFESFYALIRQTEKTLNGFMKYVRQQKAGEESGSSRMSREEFVEYEINHENEAS